MSKDLNLKSFNIKPLLAKYSQRFAKHIVFAVIIVILLTYVFVVLKTSALSKAEPTADQSLTDTSTTIPRVNQQAVDRIQSLENNNTVIRGIFNQARNNPFQE